MHIIHWANWAPRKSGMYESTKDQIKYERKAGHKSDFCDPHDAWKDGRAVLDDGWLSPVPHSVAEKADVWVLHSFIPQGLRDKYFKEKVTVAVLHGPTEHMLLKEWTTNRQQTSFNLHISILWQYDATVVLNKHEFDVMALYDEHNRLYYIPNSIDLERYRNPEYAWEYQNRPAIGSFDVPRLEKIPAHIIWAMPAIVEKIPEARLNVFSLQLEPIGMWRNMYCRSKGRTLEHLCENIQFENNNLRPFMRGMDIGFNNNFSGIASRVTMEMQAMGKPVISFGGEYTPYVAKIFSLNSIAEQVVRCWQDIQKDPEGVAKRTSAYATQHYDREKHVASYIRLYEKLLNARK